MKITNLTLYAHGVAGFLLATVLGNSNPAHAQSPPMTRWVDPLPVPPVAATAKPPRKLDLPRSADYYEITMSASQHQFHRDLGPATVWTYGQPHRLTGANVRATSRARPALRRNP